MISLGTVLIQDQQEHWDFDLNIYRKTQTHHLERNRKNWRYKPVPQEHCQRTSFIDLPLPYSLPSIISFCCNKSRPWRRYWAHVRVAVTAFEFARNVICSCALDLNVLILTSFQVYSFSVTSAQNDLMSKIGSLLAAALSAHPNTHYVRVQYWKGQNYNKRLYITCLNIPQIKPITDGFNTSTQLDWTPQ